jgi:hypothetical protein
MHLAEKVLRVHLELLEFSAARARWQREAT